MCRENTPDSWNPLMGYEVTGEAPFGGASRVEEFVVDRGDRRESIYQLEWMRCAKKGCGELLIRVKLEERAWNKSGTAIGFPQNWLAVPRRAGERPVDPSVPQELARDFQEGAAILDLSPRASAVLSRRVLADLLEQYANRDEYGLKDRIDKFNEDTTHPYPLRKNLHYLREIANWAAHTEKDDQAQIVEIAREDANWLLGLIERLFDYFIVTPGQDAAFRATMDERIASIPDRKPIKPLPEDRGN